MRQQFKFWRVNEKTHHHKPVKSKKRNRERHLVSKNVYFKTILFTKMNSFSFQLCGLPNEVILLILDYLRPEDILELRATCQRLKELCQRSFLTSNSLYLNYCIFPSQIWRTFQGRSNFPKRLVIGERVEFDNFSQSETFLAEFGSHFTSLKFNFCKKLSDKLFLLLLPYFTNLEQLKVRAHFMSSEYIFAKNFQQVTSANREILRNSLAKIQSLSIKFCYISQSQLDQLTALMPRLETLKVSYITTFEGGVTSSCMTNFVSRRVTQLKALGCGDSSSDGLNNQFFSAMSKFEGLKLKSFTFTMKGVSEDVLIEFLQTQLDLEELKMYHSWQASNHLIEWVGRNLTKLRRLCLKNGVPQLRGLSFMRALKQLENLELSDNRDIMSTFQFNPDFHAAFGIEETFPRLQFLKITNLVKPICAACWSKILTFFPNIRTLYFYQVVLDENSTQQIFKLTDLTSLTLDRCGITEAQLQSVGSQTRLRHLNVKRNHINSIPVLPNLRFLDASATELSKFEELVSGSPHLEKLILNECNNLEGQSISVICQHLRKLKHLNISRCQRPIHWDSIWENCKYLQILIAEGSTMTCQEMNTIFEKIPSLVFLKFSTLGVRRFESRHDELMMHQRN